MDDAYGGEPRRRRFVGVVTSGVAVGLAGCLQAFGNGDDDTDSTGDDDTDDSAGSGYAVDDHPIDEPMEFTGDHHCAICNMTPVDYSDWMGQLAHEDGTGVFFCSTGCLSAYIAVPDHFGAPDAAIEAVWTTEYETGELIDAEEAAFALDDDESGDSGPMPPNPRAFEDHDDAVAYVESAEHLDEDDVIGFDEIDADVAAIFRETRLP